MRIVFIAPDPTRDRFRAELAAHGVQILTESADRDSALKLLPVLQPDLVLLEERGHFASALAWAEQAIGLVPGIYLCLMGPGLDSTHLLELMRAGVREYLPEPAPAQVLEALARAGAAQASVAKAAPAEKGSAKGQPSGEVAVVFSPKGGSGKSTLAANMALAFHQVTGTRATLVDLSLQFGEQDLLLNLQPQKGLSDLLPVLHDLDARALEQTLTPSPIGVRLLAAPARLEDGEALTGEHVERAFEVLRAQKGWTVVDCASHLDEPTCKALELADVVLMPMAFDLASIRRVARAFEIFAELGIPVEKIKLVAWTSRGEITAADVARTLGRPVAFQLPWDPEGVAAAVNQGIPLLIGQPSAPLAAALRLVAAELAGQDTAQKAKDNPLADLLSTAMGWFKRRKNVPLLTAGSGAP